jgi:hypothetical protein
MSRARPRQPFEFTKSFRVAIITELIFYCLLDGELALKFWEDILISF